ncbi:hypothetical protein Tco_0917935 [Tanacetum coccineum]
MGVRVSSDVVERAATLIGYIMLTSPFKYLGVKFGGNMSRINSWDEVISKVSTRLSKWKLKTLSISGRLTLLKSVITSIPLYHMSIFKVLMGVLNKMESIRRNFFNGVDGLDRKIAWIGWDKVLASKKNDGLGVFSFFAHNRALLFKWVWHFLTDNGVLSGETLDVGSLLAMRGPSACLNFADSVWRLPIPQSSDVIDIQKAAAEAAKAFRPIVEIAKIVYELDEDEIFGMPGVIDSMAEGLMLPSPHTVGHGNYFDDVELFDDMYLWCF